MPSHDAVNELAYELWRDRGSPANDDWTDWFEAEDELREGGGQGG